MRDEFILLPSDPNAIMRSFDPLLIVEDCFHGPLKIDVEAPVSQGRKVPHCFTSIERNEMVVIGESLEVGLTSCELAPVGNPNIYDPF